MKKPNSATYKKAMFTIGEKYGWKCANCGKPIPQTIDCIAHIETKNGMSRKDRLTMALPVCRALHQFEHTRAKNLLKISCVFAYQEKYGSHKNFLRPLWEEVNKC